MATFWALIQVLQHHSAGCTVSAGRDFVSQHVIYGGNCVQAFVTAVHVPDSLLSMN